jgi:hypothetical protein
VGKQGENEIFLPLLFKTARICRTFQTDTYDLETRFDPDGSIDRNNIFHGLLLVILSMILFHTNLLERYSAMYHSKNNILYKAQQYNNLFLIKVYYKTKIEMNYCWFIDFWLERGVPAKLPVLP